MAKTVSEFRCTECGWTSPKWMGRCAECQQWGTVIEVGERTGILKRVTPLAPNESARARPITEVDTAEVGHVPSGIGELDRVLGGG
ncbi:MAG: DNA repair protein RadA, partial [Agromyces sp.]